MGWLNMSGPSTSTVGSSVTVSYSLNTGGDTYGAYQSTYASCSGGTITSYGQSSARITITSLPCSILIINYYNSGWNTMTSASGSWSITAASTGGGSTGGGGTTVTPWVNAPGKPVYAGNLKPGGAVTVSWTAATGYSTVYYTVQRQINVGSWVTVNASTTATSIADTLPSDALTVAYRVMAKSGTASSAYVTGDTVALNSPPGDPLWINYGTPYANRAIVLTCSPVTDPEGDDFEYVWEGRTDSNAYTTVAVTTEPTATVTVPNAGVTVQYRVKAVDVNGAESAYATGSPKAIIYNWPPVISGTNEDKGRIKAPFIYDFSVDDPDEDDILRATVKLDGNVLFELDDVVRNQMYKADLEESWLYLPAGKHTLTIYAQDNNGGSDTRTIVFERYCNALELETRKPIETDSIVQTIMPFFNYRAPGDATVLLQLRNDPQAEWEDVTAYNYSREIYTFVNETRSVFPAQLEARVFIQKGDSGGDIFFYGAMLLLDANGEDTINWATGMHVNVNNYPESGTLTPADNTVMKALNTLSLATREAGLRVLGYYSSESELYAEHEAGGTEGDIYAVGSDMYVWSASTGTWKNVGSIAGIPGPKGEQGETGAKGDRGEQGPTGAKGQQGDKGEPGADGKDGRDGLNGQDGQDGRDGLDGKDGADGRDGEDGKDGVDGLTIIPRAHYDSEADLQAAHPVGESGHCYAVGTQAPYDIYYWDDETQEWGNLGQISVSVDWNDIAGKPAFFPPEAHGHAWDGITGKPVAFPPETHGHVWDDVADKPATFEPAAHEHALIDVDGLQAALSANAGQAGAAQTTANAALPKAGGTMTGNLVSNNPAVATSAVRNIYAGTADLTAGTSPLTTGAIYFVYE